MCSQSEAFAVLEYLDAQFSGGKMKSYADLQVFIYMSSCKTNPAFHTNWHFMGLNRTLFKGADCLS